MTAKVGKLGFCFVFTADVFSMMLDGGGAGGSVCVEGRGGGEAELPM